ncbi:hypothetical protein PAHAL_9G013400 [Panicum hallii]|jgi:hypothetical protein|uniref:Anther-specific protein BCP1 n=1 Tax=Panicum hallii TaxID=206008 RepID=A0A2S3IGA3_9POAL|nr:uncharacterized protein LOC112874953 [Panicum hallii]PAN44050.1 hypothetical protein PAHAL_9G013400 [Panicum hallii]
MAAHRELLLLLLAAAVIAALAAVASADDAKPTILTPVAQTPLGSFDGDTPASDDDSVDDDDDAAPVGAPTGATMTEPKPELISPPGTEATAGGAAASGAPADLGVLAARVGAVAAVAAGVFAF